MPPAPSPQPSAKPARPSLPPSIRHPPPSPPPSAPQRAIRTPDAGISLARRTVGSQVGQLTLVAGANGLVAILWQDDDPRRVRFTEPIEDADHPVLTQTAQQLTEYFARQRMHFSILLDMRGTPFQQQVWRALQAIPFGETRTYGQLATQLGNPAATRAVGAANGRNPLSIVVPCHRVIGSSGKLIGFAGGLEAKAYLLDLETVGQSLFP